MGKVTGPPSAYDVEVVLVELLDGLPADHPDRCGVSRALEVLRVDVLGRPSR